MAELRRMKKLAFLMSNFSSFLPNLQKIILFSGGTFKQYTPLQNYDIQSSDWVNIKKSPGFDFAKPLIALGRHEHFKAVSSL